MGGLLLFCVSSPPEVIEAERRLASEKPTLSATSLADGEFLKEAEAYLLDAMPYRQKFFVLHANFFTRILKNPRCHGIRLGDCGLEKLLPRYDGALCDYNLDTIEAYLKRFCDGKRAFAALIPDKGYYTRPSGDYDQAIASLSARDAFTLVAVRDSFCETDYFTSDIHIRPECYGAFAARLSDAMGFDLPYGLTCARRERRQGVLAKQLPVGTLFDDFTYLYDTGGAVVSCRVTVGEKEYGGLYTDADFDPYDAYLGGEVGGGIIRVQSPKGDPTRRLIVFRDSFARAFLPYLVKGYGEIILVDMRAPYRQLASEAALFADDCTDILVLISTHTFFTTKF